MVVSDYYRVAGSCRIGETSAALAGRWQSNVTEMKTLERVA